MPAFYIIAFIGILGVITLIPTSVGRKVVRQTEAIIAQPTVTTAPMQLPITQSVTNPTTPAPTLHIRPINRQEQEIESE